LQSKIVLKARFNKRQLTRIVRTSCPAITSRRIEKKAEARRATADETCKTAAEIDRRNHSETEGVYLIFKFIG
jgi:hypothetical protein